MERSGGYQFDDFVVDLEAWQLDRAGRVVHLEPVVLKLLVYLIEHRERLVSREELMDTVWGDTVVSESAVNKAIARLRKALGDASTHPRYIETVHSLGYRFIADVKAGRERLEPGSRPPQSRRHWVTGAAIVALLALALILFSGNLPDEPGREAGAGMSEPVRSLAVLPLDNLAGDPEQDYFVEGLHDVLITDLSKIEGLKVISRQSTMRFKDSDKPLPQIARELNVDALLEGGALLLDGQVKVTAQLIHGRTDEHVWAQTYDRELSNVMALLGEVAHSISEEIELSLRPREAARLIHARPVDPAAYEAYLRGLYRFNRFGIPDFAASLEHFHQAIDIDPDFALAWTGLAGAHLMIAYFGNEPPGDAVRQGRTAALRALELDDRLWAAHAALGWVRLFTRDWPGAGQAFERALQLNPNDAMTLHGYADHLMLTGRPEESLVQVRRAQTLDPLTPASNLPVPFHLYMMRRYDDSIAETQALLDRHPGFPAQWLLALNYWQKGLREEALEAHRQDLARASDTQLISALERGRAEAGPGGALLAMAEALVARSAERYVDPFKIASTFAQAGDVERALKWLEAAVKRGSPELMYIGLRPDFDPLREDPRFDAFVQGIGLPGQSRSAGG